MRALGSFPRRFHGVTFVLFFCVVLPLPRLGAVDFLRGDANGDRSVSISDAHSIFSHLFRSLERPDCAKAADSNDDGWLNITDAVAILNFLILEGPAPSAPFPEPGSDATVDDLVCDSWGDGAPIEDPAAEIAILDAVAGGGESAAVVITLGVSSSAPIAGFSCVISAGEDVFSDVAYSSDLSGTFEGGFNGVRVVGGDVIVGFLSSFFRELWIPPGERTAVLEIGMCLRAGLPAGDYALSIDAGELCHATSGRAIAPTFAGATLTVPTDVSDEAECRRGPPPPERPDQVRITFRLGDAVGHPGDTAGVGFSVKSNVPVQGLDFSIDFDEQNLRLAGIEQRYHRLGGMDWDFWRVTVDNSNASPGNDVLSEGYVAGSAVFAADPAGFLPAGGEREVLDFLFEVAATAGTCLPVTFADGGVIDLETGSRVANEATALGETINVGNADSFRLDSALIRLLPANAAEAPEELEAEYRLGSGEGVPGSEVVLPFSILANAEVQGFAVSIDFDEEVLEATAVERLHAMPAGEPWDFFVSRTENSNVTPGNGGTDEGYVVAAAVFSFVGEICGGNIPANEETDVLGLAFRIRPGVEPTMTEVSFEDGGRSGPQSPETENVVTAFGLSIHPERASSFVFVAGFVNVAPDIAVFVRGDSNGDGVVNISDAEHLLGFLFRGGPRPRCFDAADANDDGRIDISDPIRALGYLFLGRDALPPPFLGAGEDPTEDPIECFGITNGGRRE